MRKIQKKISVILGIKDDAANSDIQILMAQELVNIPQIEQFENYVRTNHNTINTSYKTPFQKFLFLVDQYKAQLRNSILDNVENKVKEIEFKCRIVSNYIHENKPLGVSFERLVNKMDFDNVKAPLGEKEKNILKEVGSFAYCMQEFESHNFALKVEAVIKKNRLNFYDKKYAIENTQQINPKLNNLLLGAKAHDIGMSKRAGE